LGGVGEVEASTGGAQALPRRGNARPTRDGEEVVVDDRWSPRKNRGPS
jgi:hypothetical protein